MAGNQNRYKQMERYITYGLIANTLLFILYLVFAGLGIIWLKVILTIACFLISGYILYCLYISKELLRQRSLWMSVAAASIIVCIFFSLILNFP